jgi:hypothetical protein
MLELMMRSANAHQLPTIGFQSLDDGSAIHALIITTDNHSSISSAIFTRSNHQSLGPPQLFPITRHYKLVKALLNVIRAKSTTCQRHPVEIFVKGLVQVLTGTRKWET